MLSPDVSARSAPWSPLLANEGDKQAARRTDPRRPLRPEQRETPRRESDCCVWLVDRDSHTVVRCQAENLSDTGLFMTAPLGFGLASGQRYEVRVASECNALLPEGLAASLGFGTVRWTRVVGAAKGPMRMGVAIRLDLPQYPPV